ncbi:Chromosome segregation ATPase [Streptococcus pneumoniae]|nr:Chromosome segregation ATPase [Streptococcus pneumoniae]
MLLKNKDSTTSFKKNDSSHIVKLFGIATHVFKDSISEIFQLLQNTLKIIEILYALLYSIELEEKINTKMRESNDVLYPNIRQGPQINLKAHNSYSFYTPDDDGTRTKFKGIILYDLSILYPTQLPALVHDSLLLSNISYQATEALLKLYDQSKSLNKQVFLAFDKASSYSPEANQLLSENTVLKLSSDGNELYGIS